VPCHCVLERSIQRAVDSLQLAQCAVLSNSSTKKRMTSRYQPPHSDRNHALHFALSAGTSSVRVLSFIGVLLTDRMVGPAIGSIAGKPILAPLLVKLVVDQGVTHTPRKMAIRSHPSITACAAMCTLPAVRVASFCGLHPHIHETWLQVFSVNSPCTSIWPKTGPFRGVIRLSALCTKTH